MSCQFIAIQVSQEGFDISLPKNLTGPDGVRLNWAHEYAASGLKDAGYSVEQIEQGVYRVTPEDPSIVRGVSFRVFEYFSVEQVPFKVEHIDTLIDEFLGDGDDDD